MQCAAAVVVDRPHVPAWRAVGGDPDQTAHVGQPRPDLARTFVEAEPHARHQHPLQPPLQHGGKPAPPGGIDEDERVDGADEIGVLLHDRVEDRRLAVVRLALLGRHRRAETDRMQVDHLDVVSAGRQPGGGAPREFVGEAVRIGVSEDDRDAHESTTPPRSSVESGGWLGIAERSGLDDRHGHQEQREHRVRQRGAHRTGDQAADHGADHSGDSDRRADAQVDVVVRPVAERADDGGGHDHRNRCSLREDGRHREEHDHAREP